MSPLGVGIIGCGGIAQRAHLPALRYLREKATVVATADLNMAAAEHAGKTWGARAFADYCDLLELPEVDVVLIATPEHSHLQQVLDAAHAGKDVLCEKPMAPTLAEADEMIRVCEAAGVRLMIGHSRRFTRRYQLARQAVDAGDIGDVRHFRENERRPRPPMESRGEIRSVDSPDGYWTGSHWTADPRVSVGTALINGIHETDLMRWFIGAKPVSVYAEHKVTVPGNRGVPDYLSLHVEFDTGATGATEICNLIPPSYPAYHQFEILGSAGVLRAQDSELLTYARYGDAGVAYPHSQEILLRYLPAYVREQESFFDSVLQNRDVELSPHDARAALEIALGAVESAATGRVVRIEGEVNHA